MVLVLLCSYYSFESNKNLEYPSYDAILTYYPVGEVVHVQGSIIEINSDSYYIIDKYHGQKVSMRIKGDLSAHLGDEINLLGVLEPSNQIGNIKQIQVLTYQKHDFLLKRSFFALIFLFIFFFYYWKFNFSKLLFVRR